MAKIMKFSKDALKGLRSPLEDALKELGEKYGIEFRVGNGRFDEATAKFQLEMKIADKSVMESAARREFSVYASMYGLRGIDFGTQVTLQHQVWEVAGLALNRTKYPIKMRNVVTGKTMVYTTSIVDRIKAATDLKNKVPAPT
jgi:hypothetical protein